MIETENNLTISGSGTLSGGEFNKVSISGSGKVLGDIFCNHFTTSGSSKVEGTLTCQKGNVAGACKIIKDLKFTEKVDISGTIKVLGNIFGEKFRVSGAGTIEGDIKCNDLQVYGVLNSGGNIEAEEIRIFGILKNEALITAENVYIKAEGISNTTKFHEIGATKVDIGNRTGKESWFEKVTNFFSKNDGRVEGFMIEGDQVTVENASIKIIRARDVVIGPNCFVGEVEYSGTLQVHETSNVGKVSQNG